MDNYLGKLQVGYSRYISWQKERVNDFIYIYNHKSKKWIYLENVAKDMWELIGGTQGSVDDVINELEKMYDVDCETLKKDIYEIIEELLKEEIVSEKNGTSGKHDKRSL